MEFSPVANLPSLLFWIALICGGLFAAGLVGKVVERILADFHPDEETADEMEAHRG
jgi:hypothetical protein